MKQTLTQDNMPHRVTLQRNTAAESSVSGELVEVWINFATVWGNIFIDASNTQMVASKEQVKRELTVGIRHMDGVNAGMRVLIPKTRAVLSAGINNSVGSISVSKAVLSPDSRFAILRINSEFVVVTAGYGTTTLTVTRGQFGSTPVAHDADAPIVQMSPALIHGVEDEDNRRVFLFLKCMEVQQ
jgi:SPP1 family predicted phage head-tail adaptor